MLQIRKHWHRVSTDWAAAHWNSELSHFSKSSPFQTFEHGAVAGVDGWDPQYWICDSEDEGTEAMVLALVRTLPLKTGMVWIVGGPSGDISAFNGEFLEAVKRQNGFVRCYLRARMDSELNGLSLLRLSVQGLRPVMCAIGSGQTVELDLAKDFKAGLSKTWKRSLKKASKNGLTVSRWFDPDASILQKLFADLEKMRDLDTLYSKERLTALAETEGLNLFIHRCDDSEGNLLALRGQVVFGDHAVDYMAVTSDRGRELCASHHILKEVCDLLREQGVRTFELGGIDPTKNPGVSRFKIETGARRVVQLGEWDMATSHSLRLVANCAIRFREYLETATFRNFIEKITTRNSGRPRGLQPLSQDKGVQTC